MKPWLFVLCLSFFLGHELDAVSQAEWRLLYGFRDLPPLLAERWFVLLHVPLLAIVLGLCWCRHRVKRQCGRGENCDPVHCWSDLHWPHGRRHPKDGKSRCFQ